MPKYYLPALLLLGFFLCTCGPAPLVKQTNSQVAKKPARPNVLMFLVDDMGWMDNTVNGSEYYETPNMERLAKMGMNFTRAYAANPLCSPTRASILSGKHPGRFGMTTPAGHRPPNPDEDLTRTEGAPWQKVAQQGIRTFMPLSEFTIAEALKTNGYTTAHIGKWHLGQKGYWPEQQGFDVNVGGMMHPGPPSFFSPYRIPNLPDGEDKEYITDRITYEAMDFMEAHQDEPFYLNFWQFGVHAPFQAPQDLIDKYAAKTDPRGKQNAPIMGGMMEKVDQSLGMLLDKLEELDILDNTLIVFFSDNGGNMYNTIDGEFPTNNYPLRHGKGNIHDGGIRVPAIIAWPGHIEPGTVSDELIQSIDFYPTFLEATNTTGNPIQQLDGVSLVNHLTKQKPLKREAIFSHFPHYVVAPDNLPSTAAWSGDFKCIKEYGEGENRQPVYRLYNLAEDLTEMNDVAARYPKVVARMSVMIDAHVAEIGGEIPVVNPKYDPAAKSPMGTTKAFPMDKYPSY